MAITVHKDKGGFDIQSTKINLLGNFDQITQRYTTHIGIGRAGVEYRDVGGIFIDNGSDGITNLFSDQPTVIGTETRHVRAIPVHQIFKIKLFLKRHGTL